MPLLLKKVHPTYTLGIWKIEEELGFFTQQIPYVSDAVHEGRQLQQMATRYLLNELYNDFPFEKVTKDPAGKLFLPNNKLSFNISHTSQLAAVILSEESMVGIDTEKIHDRILKIQHKFLNEREFDQIQNTVEADKVHLLTRYWTIKEAVYKWWGKGGVDFSKDIIVESYSRLEGGWIVQLHKENGIELCVESFAIDGHWVSYIVQ